MDHGLRRKAKNEAVFREVNERIEGLQRTFALSTDEPLQIVCECDRIQCAMTLHVPVEVYEGVRRDFASFLVAPGHEDESVEDVVESGRDYLIVRKRAGDPQQLAGETDPRS